MSILKDANVGDGVRLYTNGPLKYPSPVKQSDISPIAWVVLVADPKNSFRNCSLLGWKKISERIGDTWRWDEYPDLSRKMEPGKYEYGYWIAHYYELADLIKGSGLISSSIKSNGMFCMGCGNFFPMAVSNRPSGNMVCYSCRLGFVPNHW